MTSKIISTVNPDGSVHKTKQENKVKKHFTFQYRDYGLYLIAPIIIGIVSGIYLDRYFLSKPLYTILLLILGTIGTFYNLYKIVKDENATR